MLDYLLSVLKVDCKTYNTYGVLHFKMFPNKQPNAILIISAPLSALHLSGQYILNDSTQYFFSFFQQIWMIQSGTFGIWQQIFRPYAFTYLWSLGKTNCWLDHYLWLSRCVSRYNWRRLNGMQRSRIISRFWALGLRYSWYWHNTRFWSVTGLWLKSNLFKRHRPLWEFNQSIASSRKSICKPGQAVDYGFEKTVISVYDNT